MQVIKVEPVTFASNTYILTEDNRNAVVIDPSEARIAYELERRGLVCKYVLLTHGHFDHIGGCAAMQAAGAKIGCMENERALALGEDNMATHFGYTMPAFSIDFSFSDGEILQLCGMNIKVLATPGHTAGSCCFLCEGALFTGDTLFCGDIGRTDLPTGDGETLQNSLRRLTALAEDYVLYAGHGADSTLFYERTHNPYLKSC